MSSFGEALAELLGGLVDLGIAMSPGREDAGHVRGFPRSEDEAAELIASLPRTLDALGRIPRDGLEVWYRGGGRQASVRLIDVAELGFLDVGSFVRTAVERSDSVDDCDLEGDLVYVATTEHEGEDGAVGSWGLASGRWVVVVTASSPEARDAVTSAIVTAIRSSRER
jgi:hypothetical protein